MSAAARQSLGSGLGRMREAFPWMKMPFIISAPMRVMSGPQLAVAVSQAGGLGFIGPGAKPEDTAKDLAEARELLSRAPPLPTRQQTPSAPASALPPVLPVGVGFQLWNGDVDAAVSAVEQYRPCAAWLFAPRLGQQEIDEWAVRLRFASPGIQIWHQIGTVTEALECARSSVTGENDAMRVDVLVVQGAEAGGHGRAEDGLGIAALLPEVQDAIRSIPRSSELSLIAAGGIADARGVAAALALGAAGVAMGTRFLASTEARIAQGYRNEVVRASDGAHSTTRTILYNRLRGTMGWPPQYSPRGIVNRSWHDERAGVPFDELKRLHDEAVASGDRGWGPNGRLATYAGAAVGLIHSVEDAGTLVEQMRTEAREILLGLGDLYR